METQLDNSFEVLAASYGYYENGTMYPEGIQESLWSLAGAGVNSTGGYMIFYFTTMDSLDSGTWEGNTVNDGSGDVPLSGWYKIPAESAEAAFSTFNWYSTLTELVTAEGDPEGYGTQVETLVTSMFTTE